MLNIKFEENWTHDRNHVRFLHHSHADQIECEYVAMQRIPGNPQQVIIEKIGAVRTFIARGHRLENRAIFNGDETPEQIDAVLNHFAKHSANCVIEVNPANSYVDPPKNWEPRLLRHLLKRQCVPQGLRCVWYRTEKNSQAERSETHQLACFGPDQTTEFADLIGQVDPNERWGAEKREPVPGRFNYVAFENGKPCGFGGLIVLGQIAYLNHWFTRPEARGRGFQQAAIRKRICDAFDLGCELLFTVTDFNFASPRNLQRCGFNLAYNYLLMRRDPGTG